MTRLLPLLICLVLASCSKSPQTPSRIRIQNLTGHDLAKVAVNTNSFGAVKAGATSEYHLIPVMFQSASIYTREPNGYFRNDRFIGGANPTLSAGNYTYILRIATNDMLEVTLRNDQ